MLFSTDLRLTCAPTTGWRVCFHKKRLTHTQCPVNLVNTREQWLLDVHPTAVVLLQSLLFMLQPLNQAPAGLPAPSSRGRLCYRAGLTALPYSHRWPSHPLLTHTCCYSPGKADEPVNPHTPPRGKQLPSIPWLCGIPFLGLAVVHCPGALGAACWGM